MNRKGVLHHRDDTPTTTKQAIPISRKRAQLKRKPKEIWLEKRKTPTKKADSTSSVIPREVKIEYQEMKMNQNKHPSREAQPEPQFSCDSVISNPRVTPISDA